MLLLLVGCNPSDFNLSDPDSGGLGVVVVEEQFVQAPAPKLDLLFVIDGTGSMAEEQAAFASAASTFVSRLDGIGLAWQVGVTTTDPADGGTLQGEPWIITSSAEDPAGAFAAAVAVGSDRPPPSAGLYGAVAAIEDEAGLNLGFLRDDAPLHVVFVSDGDDESDPWLGDDPVGATAERMAERATATGHPVRASAVVGVQAGQCDGPYGAALAGARYLDLAEATGGAQVDICTSDFSAVADAVESYGIEWPTRFALQAEPVSESVAVEIDGARVDGWTVDGAELVFATPPAAAAVIDVRYEVEG